MREIFDFLAQNPLQFCATVGLDGKPKVRPFQMMFREGGKMFFCTGAHKAVFAELNANPYVEICASTAERWLRVRGKVCWTEDEAKKRRAIESSELVRGIYGDADNPNFKLFYIGDAEAVLADFSGRPPFTVRLTEE